MDASKRTIELVELEGLQDWLRTVPARRETRVGYAKAIARLAPEIHEMRVKGYGWEEIAAMLAERGLPMSASTLRTYLGRVEPERGRASPRRKAQRPVRHPEAVDATSSVTSAPRSTSSSMPTSPAAAGEASSTSAASPAQSEEKAAAWSFPVRPDTPDL